MRRPKRLFHIDCRRIQYFAFCRFLYRWAATAEPSLFQQRAPRHWAARAFHIDELRYSQSIAEALISLFYASFSERFSFIPPSSSLPNSLLRHCRHRDIGFLSRLFADDGDNINTPLPLPMRHEITAWRFHAFTSRSFSTQLPPLPTYHESRRYHQSDIFIILF